MNSIPYKVQLISIIGTIIFMMVVGRLILKGKLREEYSLVWLLCTGVLVLFSLWRNGLDYLASRLGIFYPPSLLFLFLIVAIICILVHLSVVNSKQHNQIKALAHELALLSFEFDQLKKKLPVNEEEVVTDQNSSEVIDLLSN